LAADFPPEEFRNCYRVPCCVLAVAVFLTKKPAEMLSFYFGVNTRLRQSGKSGFPACEMPR
jgi:hypothetical protein